MADFLVPGTRCIIDSSKAAKPMNAIDYRPGPIQETWTANNVDLSSFNTALSAYWNLNESSGNRTDSVGGFIALDINTVAQGEGIWSQAALFVGNTLERLNVPRTGQDSFNIAGLLSTRQFTISVWINSDASGTAAILGSITNSPANGSWLYLNNVGYPKFQIISNDTIIDTLEYTTDVTDLSWHHIVVTCNGVNAALYVDGVLRDSSTVVSTFPDTGLNTDIGADGQSPSAYYDGLIDELAFWNTPLSQTEVDALWNGGVGSFFIG